MRKLTAISMLVLVLVGCSRAPKANPAEENRIRVAVFEYEMQEHPAAVYFLSIGEAAGDPSDVIMKHFDGNVPPVKAASQCTAGPGGSVNDMMTGDTGVLIKAAAINWISETEVEVKGGYLADAKSVSGNTVHVVLQDGEWAVDKDKVDWGS